MPSRIKDSIGSVILQEERNLDVILPNNYDAETTCYDVWYVLDGEWNTFTFTNITAYLATIGFAPRVIVVGLLNRSINGFNSRDRDLTPTPEASVDGSGGAAPFLDFIEQELMPYIQQKYRTSGESGLFGASFGGLFAMYALLQRPGLFRFYALSDPAFHYDQSYVLKLAAQRLPELALPEGVLHIGGRSGSSYAYMARDEMDSLLKTNAPTGLKWRSVLYDDETHNSCAFKSSYDGLKFAYFGYSAMQARFNLTGGIVLKDRPVRMFLATDHAEIRYTTDGTVPTQSSCRFEEFLVTSDPEQLGVKSFSPSGRYDLLIKNNLRSGDYLTAAKCSRKVLSAGRLDNTWKSDGSGRMNGYVAIPTDGYYLLQLTPSPGTQLHFNNSLLIVHDPAEEGMQQTVILPLRKGNYALRLEHLSKDPADPALNFGLYYSETGQDDWWKNPLVR
jgi:predicted alpha/beta superfamily hydrolase